MKKTPMITAATIAIAPNPAPTPAKIIGSEESGEAEGGVVDSNATSVVAEIPVAPTEAATSASMGLFTSAVVRSSDDRSATVVSSMT
jgi:hypothetical protein